MSTDVRLTKKEEEMLLAIDASNRGRLSRLFGEHNAQVGNSLVRKGMAEDIMQTFYAITPAGRERARLLKS